MPVSWVRESTRSGAIPHVRLGRYVGFVQVDVEACPKGTNDQESFRSDERAAGGESV